MDQYVVKFEYTMLYFDMIELVELIKNSGSEYLLSYVDSLQTIIDAQ